MQKPSSLPSQLHITTLGGINQRVSPAGLKPGEFSWLEGLYPSQNGSLSRVPGKHLLATLAGNAGALNFCQTFNRNGDILVQDDEGNLYAYTLDELYGRQTNPSLTPNGFEEEGMSIAIMYQEEANTALGGSAIGYLTGTDSTSAAGTTYGRRLTINTVNSGAIVSFTASTGGTAAQSTPGQFVLSPGTYRIDAWFLFGNPSASEGAQIGLYNVTNAAFQLDDASGTPPAAIIISSPAWSASGSSINLLAEFSARFVVSGSNNTFQLNQTGSNSTQMKNKSFGGSPSAITGTIFNGAAPKQRYGMVKILKEP